MDGPSKPAGKPEVGFSGRKIIYDENGKPYVPFLMEVPFQLRQRNTNYFDQDADRVIL